ncbi:hypothetical protein ADJ73_02530 [Arsenicicoccus sp. oral taxon 190]|nr:hypothetical protein ADJ73_02530 [Arsenicicoccus sp. oral taxon 190]
MDVLLALLLLSAALNGWRHGFVLATFSTAGLVGGAALGMWLLPPLLDDVAALQRSLPLRAGALCLGVLVIASLGQLLLGRLGAGLRAHNRLRPTQLVDALAGAVASVLVVAALAWFAGDTLRLAAPGGVARTVAGSRVLRGIDAVMPAQVGRVFAGFRSQLEASDFPRVFEGLGAEPIAPAQPPDPRVAQTPGVVAARRSVVKVVGDAPSCRRQQDGSGWVTAPHRVVTNAHVVAGTTQVRVQAGGEGRAYAATVVAFDPRLDVAVLLVPELQAAPLQVAGTLPANAGAVVAGFPGGGPYRLGAARVRSVMAARGSDIYGSAGALRQVYSLYATVRPGNSGGPLLTTDGRVAGTIFAQSVDDPSTGYALTTSATQEAVAAGATSTAPAATGRCTVG